MAYENLQKGQKREVIVESPVRVIIRGTGGKYVFQTCLFGILLLGEVRQNIGLTLFLITTIPLNQVLNKEL